MARDVKSNKKTSYRYIGQKRQAETGVPSLVNSKGELASTDEEKAEVLNEFFASVFTGGQDSSLSHVPEPCPPKPPGGDQGGKFPPPHCKGRASPRPPHETGVKVFGARWCASQGSEGVG